MTASPDRRAIVRASLGVGIAPGLYGASFGAISVGSGLTMPVDCGRGTITPPGLPRGGAQVGAGITNLVPQ